MTILLFFFLCSLCISMLQYHPFLINVFLFYIGLQKSSVKN